MYHVISETDKKQFHPTIGVEEIENILESSVPDTIDDYEDYIENITKKVRSKNRFDYFALKFLDDTHVFKNFRFQIDLGKLILDEYQKPLNGIEEERKVVENVKAFGRLQDFRNNEENLINEINRSDSNLCFEQFAPHYNFDTNKIGLAFFDDNHKKGMKSYATFTVKVNKPKKVKAHLEQPEITAFLSTNELSKIILLEYLEKGKSEKLIKDFITINDSTIFNLEFIETVKTKMADLNKFYKKSQGRRNKHAYILKIENNKEKIDIEKINDLKNRKETLNLVLEEYALNEKQIPTRIVDYWLNIIDVRDEIIFSDRIKLMKRNCIDRLKDIKKDKSPKIGEMASFLAKDIIDMIIDPQKKEKITSFYYDKIQQCLALYADEEKRKLLSQIFKELDINGVGGHPFLNRINFQEIKYTQDIYKLYLEEKGQKLSGPHDSSWMQKFFYVKERNEKIGKDLTVVKMPKDISKIPHTIVQFQKEKNSFKDWYKNITEGKEVTDRKKPIDLPTNLFDDSLKLLLQEKLESANIEFDESVNYNKLFKTWWTKCRLDDTQPFYKAKRSYVFEENELVFETNTKPKFKDYCSNDFINKVFKIKGDRRVIEKRSNPKLPHINRAEVAKNIHHKLGTTEKEIRILEEQDRLMLLMFEQLIGVETNPKLKKIDALLNETITIKERVTGKLYFDDKGEEIKDKSQKKDIAKNITENRKRKEFSVLRKYSNDKRLPELFEYFEAENLPVEQLKIELDSYNNAKEIVFDLIFKLEKAIVEKDKIGVLECVEEPKEHLQHKPFLKWLLTKKIITENEYVFMNMIRKTFSHNQFAQKTSIELVLKNWSENKFAMQMVDLYKQKTEQIISEIAVF